MLRSRRIFSLRMLIAISEWLLSTPCEMTMNSMLNRILSQVRHFKNNERNALITPLGTCKKGVEIDIPTGVTKVIEAGYSQKELIDAVIESDIIIYHILDCKFDEVEYILKSNTTSSTTT